jgi:hypothetical protein
MYNEGSFAAGRQDVGIGTSEPYSGGNCVPNRAAANHPTLEKPTLETGGSLPRDRRSVATWLHTTLNVVLKHVDPCWVWMLPIFCYLVSVSAIHFLPDVASTQAV